MSLRWVELPIECSACRGRAGRGCRIAMRGLDIRYAESFHCGSCGLAQEFDGDEVPDDVRLAFYEAEGRWSVVIARVEERRRDVLAALRKLPGFELSDLPNLMAGRAPLRVGTLVEVEAVAALIRHAGGEVAVFRV